MSDKSGIEWTDATWSPITGCDPISAGCKHCYAKREVETRWSKNSKSVWFGRPFNDVRCHPEKLTGASSPLSWKWPRRIFVCPRADLFHENVAAEFIRAVFNVMAACPQHTFQVLTKRAARMHFLLRSEFDWQPLPNVWLGVSVENQDTADERIPLLLEAPAAVRWISAEPLLGPIDLTGIEHPHYSIRSDVLGGVDSRGRGWGDDIQPGPMLDWVVAGGESGPNARPMHPTWVRSLRDQCAATGVPFLFKQHGEWISDEDIDNCGALSSPEIADADEYFRTHSWPDHAKSYRVGKRAAGRHIDGKLHDEYPA